MFRCALDVARRWRRRSRSTASSRSRRRVLPTASNRRPRRTRSSAAPSGDNGIGWGSSIEVGRLARGAEDALRTGQLLASRRLCAARGESCSAGQQAVVPAGLHLAPGGALSERQSRRISTGCRCARQRRRHERAGPDLRPHGAHRRCQAPADAGDQCQSEPHQRPADCWASSTCIPATRRRQSTCCSAPKASSRMRTSS